MAPVHRALACLLASTLLLSAHGLALPTVDSLVEEVDIRGFQYARTKLSITLPASYLAERKITEESLAELCRRELGGGERSSFIRCDARVLRRDGGRSEVQFTVLDQPRLAIKDVGFIGPRLRLDVLFEHMPKQFAFSRGYRVLSRQLVVVYPTHRTVLDDVGESTYSSTFSLVGAPEALPFKPARDSYSIGEAVEVPKLDGELCAAALVREGVAVAKELSLLCRPTAIGTSALLEPGEYELLVASYRLGKLSLARASVRLTEPSLAVSASVPGGPRALLGEAFRIEASSSAAISACELTVLTMDGFKVGGGYYRGCADVVVGTSTSWVPGKHLVKLRAVSGGLEGFASLVVDLVGRGQSVGGEPALEPLEVMPGGEVRVHPDPSARCDYVRTELYDKDWVRIAEQETPGCDSVVTVPVPPSTPPGPVLVKVKEVEDGKVKAVSSKVLTVMEWRPVQRTQRFELCRDGSMHAGELSLPCIGPEDRCFPTTTALPLCLCFDEGASASAVCEYGQRCSAGACSDTELSKNPFIIVHEGGRCLARRGLETMECLEVGEVCAGTCVCLDTRSSPTSSCTFGETCTPDGCRKVDLALSVDQPPPDHARAEELAAGTDLSWRFHVKASGQFLQEEAEGSLKVRALVGDLEASRVEAIYLDAEKGWSVTAHLSGTLEPGRYDAFLVVQHGESLQVARSPFSVWHSASEAALDVSVKATTPGALGARQLRTGASVKALVRVADASRSLVEDLPQEAFSMRLGELEAVAVAATYQRIAGMWEVVGTFRSIQTPASGPLVVRVSRLGREGQAQAPFSVVEKVPLELKIVKASPGNADEPLFYVLVAMGFDMDLFLSVRGADTLTRDSFTITVDDRAIPSENLVDMVSTAEGVRLHLSRVNLCPDVPPPDTPIPVVVEAKAGGESASDRSLIYVEGNPGDWSNLEEAGCR